MRLRLMIALLSFLTVITASAQNKDFYLLVGGMTTGTSSTEGLSVYKFNTTTGIATLKSKISGVEDPTYFAITKDQKYVYSVNEYNGKDGDISAFTFDKTKGELHFINKTTSTGGSPCYIAVDSTGKWVVAANYGAGSLVAFQTGSDGSIQPAAEVIEHQGYSVHFTRQSKPHVHCTVFTPDGKYVLANDLGTDKVYGYKFNPSNATQPLSQEDTTLTETPDGSGPRHITFHPNGKYAYLINELSGKVIVYEYNNGRLTEVQSIESTTIGDKQDKGSADIHITPNGQYLYTTNRGSANEITCYRVGSTGLLTLINKQSCLGVHPRNFMIDPTGKFLLVANRDSDEIVVFAILRSTGFLQPTNNNIKITKPVCLKMMDVK